MNNEQALLQAENLNEQLDAAVRLAGALQTDIGSDPGDSTSLLGDANYAVIRSARSACEDLVDTIQYRSGVEPHTHRILDGESPVSADPDLAYREGVADGEVTMLLGDDDPVVAFDDEGNQVRRTQLVPQDATGAVAIASDAYTFIRDAIRAGHRYDTIANPGETLLIVRKSLNPDKYPALRMARGDDAWTQFQREAHQQGVRDTLLSLIERRGYECEPTLDAFNAASAERTDALFMEGVAEGKKQGYTEGYGKGWDAGNEANEDRDEMVRAEGYDAAVADGKAQPTFSEMRLAQEARIRELKFEAYQEGRKDERAKAAAADDRYGSGVSDGVSWLCGELGLEATTIVDAQAEMTARGDKIRDIAYERGVSATLGELGFHGVDITFARDAMAQLRAAADMAARAATETDDEDDEDYDDVSVPFNADQYNRGMNDTLAALGYGGHTISQALAHRERERAKAKENGVRQTLARLGWAGYTVEKALTERENFVAHLLRADDPPARHQQGLPVGYAFAVDDKTVRVIFKYRDGRLVEVTGDRQQDDAQFAGYSSGNGYYRIPLFDSALYQVARSAITSLVLSENDQPSDDWTGDITKAQHYLARLWLAKRAEQKAETKAAIEAEDAAA